MQLDLDVEPAGGAVLLPVLCAAVVADAKFSVIKRAVLQRVEMPLKGPADGVFTESDALQKRELEIEHLLKGCKDFCVHGKLAPAAAYLK